MKIFLLIVAVILLLLGSLVGAFIATGLDVEDHKSLVNAQASAASLQEKVEKLKKLNGGELPADVKADVEEAANHLPPNPELATYGGYLGWTILALSLLTIVITFAKPDLLLILTGLIVVATIAAFLVHPQYEFSKYHHTDGKLVSLIAGGFAIAGSLAAFFAKRKPTAAAATE